MSHKATTWLSTLGPDALSHGEFRVLFHLADCHNPSEGCFPKQSYLIKMTGLSNGGLNKALSIMEGKGLIRRHRTVDNETKRRRPTHYILGFEFDDPQEPSPLSGDGKSGKPSPLSGDGAISTGSAKPSPLGARSHLHSSGDIEPVIEPVREPRAKSVPRIAPKNPAKNRAASDDEIAEFWAVKINAGAPVKPSAMSTRIANLMVRRGMVTLVQLRNLGIAC